MTSDSDYFFAFLLKNCASVFSQRLVIIINLFLKINIYIDQSERNQPFFVKINDRRSNTKNYRPIILCATRVDPEKASVIKIYWKYFLCIVWKTRHYSSLCFLHKSINSSIDGNIFHARLEVVTTKNFILTIPKLMFKCFSYFHLKTGD